MQLSKKKKTPPMEEAIEEFSISGGYFINCTYVENSMMYIAGFVFKKNSTPIKCEKCKVALFNTRLELADARCMFLNIKDNGGLSRSSKSVFLICLPTERAIRSDYFGCGFKKVKKCSIEACNVIQGLLGRKIFEELTDHVLSL